MEDSPHRDRKSSFDPTGAGRQPPLPKTGLEPTRHEQEKDAVMEFGANANRPKGHGRVGGLASICVSMHVS
jgi:hypothetical protein